MVKISENVKRVYVCSPLRAETHAKMMSNMRTAWELAEVIGSCYRVKAYAPHSVLPLVLDDNDILDRQLAIKVDLEILKTCDALIVCGSRISEGMREEILFAKAHNIPVYRLPAKIIREAEKKAERS